MNISTIELYSLLLTVLAATGFGLVGSFALMKKTILAGDVMSHIALPGLGLAILFKINPLLGGAATLFAGAILIWQLEKTTGLSTEAMIGVVFSASLAVGALITPNEDLIDALFGGFQTLSAFEFFIGALAGILVISFIFKYKNQLVFSLFSPDLAMVSGINVSKLNLWFLLIFSLTIILGLRFLGALLVGSLIIIPAATGRQLTHALWAFLTVSSLISVVSVIAGFFISRGFGLSPGPTTVTVAAVIFALSLLKKKV